MENRINESSIYWDGGNGGDAGWGFGKSRAWFWAFEAERPAAIQEKTVYNQLHMWIWSKIGKYRCIRCIFPHVKIHSFLLFIYILITKYFLLSIFILVQAIIFFL